MTPTVICLATRSNYADCLSVNRQEPLKAEPIFLPSIAVHQGRGWRASLTLALPRIGFIVPDWPRLVHALKLLCLDGLPCTIALAYGLNRKFETKMRSVRQESRRSVP